MRRFQFVKAVDVDTTQETFLLGGRPTISEEPVKPRQKERCNAMADFHSTTIYRVVSVISSDSFLAGGRCRNKEK